MACWQDIIAIPVKKQDRPAVRHLTVGQARLLLAQPVRCPKLSGQGSNRILIWKGTGSSAGEAETIHSRV